MYILYTQWFSKAKWQLSKGLFSWEIRRDGIESRGVWALLKLLYKRHKWTISQLQVNYIIWQNGYKFLISPYNSRLDPILPPTKWDSSAPFFPQAPEEDTTMKKPAGHPGWWWCWYGGFLSPGGTPSSHPVIRLGLSINHPKMGIPIYGNPYI